LDLTAVLGPELEPAELTALLLRRGLATVPADAGRAVRALRVDATRAWLRWLRGRGELRSEVELVRPKKAAAGLPRVLSPEQARDLVESAPTPRDRALLEVLYGTGVTARECCALDVEDLELNARRRARHWVRVPGSAARRVPLGRLAVDALERYLSAGPPGPRPLFLDGGRRLTPLRLRRHLQGLAGARYGAPVTPRVLRESCGVHLLDGGADIRTVQMLLGHRDSRSTTRLERAAIARLIAIYRRAFPLARIRTREDG
jgi:integrase/recombinase XerC